MPTRTTLFVGLALAVAGAASVPATRPTTATAATTTSKPTTTAATTTSRPATTSAPAAKSTLEGVFNAEQVARGKKSYLASCARCHGDNLAGNDDAVALVGDEFIGKWTGKPVSDLVEYTRTQMPADGPGRFDRKEITDIIVYLLDANSLPAGKAELSSELDVLKRIQLQVKK